MAFSTPAESPGEQYALSICLSLLATVMVGLRLYAVRIRKHGISHDDWWIVFALIFTWATAIVNIVGAAAGDESRHTSLSAQGQPLYTQRYKVFLQAIYANQLVQLLAVGPTKLSVLLFYRRIFVGKIFNILTWITMVIVSCWTIAFFFGNLLECIPISRAWAHVVGGYPDPRCIDAVVLYLAQAWIDVFLDLIILLIPIPLIWKLQMPIRRRVAIISIFLVGILTIAASCAKLVIQMFVGTEIEKQADISYFLTPVMYWPLIEAALGITAACLPRLSVLFDKEVGLSKLIRDIYSTISSGSLSLKRSKASSYDDSFTTSKNSMDVELGQPVAPCGHRNVITGGDENRDGHSHHQLSSGGVVVDREFGTSIYSNTEKSEGEL